MEYLGTIIVSLILLAIVVLIIRNMVKAKRQGKSASCSSCSSGADCHSTSACCDPNLDAKLNEALDK